MTIEDLKTKVQRLISDGTRHFSRADYVEFLDWLISEGESRETALKEEDMQDTEDRL